MNDHPFRGWVILLDPPPDNLTGEPSPFVVVGGQADTMVVAKVEITELSDKRNGKCLRACLNELFNVPKSTEVHEIGKLIEMTSVCLFESARQGLPIKITLAKFDFAKCPVCTHDTLPQTCAGHTCPICGWIDTDPVLDETAEHVPDAATSWELTNLFVEIEQKGQTQSVAVRRSIDRISKTNNMTISEAQTNYKHYGAVNRSHHVFALTPYQWRESVRQALILRPFWDEEARTLSPWAPIVLPLGK